MKKLGALVVITAIVTGIAGVAGCNSSSSSSASSATYDLSGVWRAMLMPVSVSGDCPAGRAQQGTATIQQSGSSFSLALAGFDCRPAGACSFQGTVEGVRYTASNGGVADGEGGRYANEIVMDADSEQVAQGFLSSSYTHPQMSCSWESTFVLSR